MITSYERACKEAGLSEEKTAEIRRFFDAEQKKLKYLKKMRMEHGVCQGSLDNLLEEYPEMEPKADENVEEKAIHAVDLMNLRKYLQELDEDERDFLIQCFEGTSERELAERYGISRGSLRRKRDALILSLQKKFGVNES